MGKTDRSGKDKQRSLQVMRAMALCNLLAALLACGSPAGPKIQVENIWARPASQAADMGGTSAVFMSLQNEGREADRLIGAQTEVAQTAEIHESVMEGEVVRMRHLAEGLELPAGAEVVLQPGGYHVMLMGLTRDLQVRDRFELVLEFATSEAITVEVEVKEP